MLSSSSSLTHQQFKATQTPQQGISESEFNITMGASSNRSPTETELKCRHHPVPDNAANAASDYMTIDAQSKIVSTTSSIMNRPQQPIEWEYICIEVDNQQITIEYTICVGRELRDHFLPTHVKKPLRLIKAFVRTVCAIENYHVVSCCIFARELRDKGL